MTRLSEYGLGRSKDHLSQRSRGFVETSGRDVQLLRRKSVRTGLQASIVKGFADLHRTVAFTISLLFQEGRAYASCGMNGHTINRNAWSNKFPKCTDCGQEVLSAHQLRSSYFEKR